MDTTMIEEWRSIPSSFGYYEASNLGNIRRIGKLKPLKPSSNKNAGDRLHVCFSIGGIVTTHNVHVLVAEAFYGPKSEGEEVNHVDLDYRNNKVDNLEYITHSENQRHSVQERGSAWGSCGVKSLTDFDAEVIRELYREVPNYAAIARSYGVSEMTIRRVIVGRNGVAY